MIEYRESKRRSIRMNDSPTQMLEDEHRVIAKVVGAAPVLADRLEAGQAVDRETLDGVIEFMRIFADKCHHGKEEELLFPLLGKKGIPLEGCPVGVLTGEHKKGRTLVMGLAGAADAYQKGDPGGKQAVIDALRGIAGLYPNHIWKEDYLLFPLTNKVLAPEEQQTLYQQFEQVEETIGRDVHHRLEQFAELLGLQTQGI
jgi:hemerythrin-like domain-containing protein